MGACTHAVCRTTQCHKPFIDAVSKCGSLIWCRDADTTVPVITCPADVIEVELGTTHDIDATATDASGDLTISCRDTATFALGTGSVECTASDASGLMAKCYAKVLVVGELPPPHPPKSCSVPNGSNALEIPLCAMYRAATGLC